MFFWAKPADSPEWEEIPVSGGLLVAGTYNIAVQSPQPHFTISSHLRQYCRQEDGTETLCWQTEHSSRTNGEGVGWIVQDLQLTAGRWQISCRDSDLVAELFGEDADDSITFQVIDLKGAQLFSGPYRESSVSLPPMTASPSEIAIQSAPAPQSLPTSQSPPNPQSTPINARHNPLDAIASVPVGTLLNRSSQESHGQQSEVTIDMAPENANGVKEEHIGREPSPNIEPAWHEPEAISTTDHSRSSHPSSPAASTPFSLSADDAVTEIFSLTTATPTAAPDQEFALNCSEFTAFPGEILEITGHSRQSGQLTITALTKNSIPIQESQRLQVRSSEGFATFSVQLQVPETWSEEAIIGVAELHPDNGSASLAQDFTISAEPRYSAATSPLTGISEATPSYQPVDRYEEETELSTPEIDQLVDQPDPIQAATLQDNPSPASSEHRDTVTAIPADESLDSPSPDTQPLSNAQFTKTDSRSTISRAAAWNPELTDNDLQPPEVAFASSRTLDRTLARMLALVQSSVAATAARTRFQQAQTASPSLVDGIVDGIIGDVKVVPATESPMGTPLPPNGRNSLWQGLETDNSQPNPNEENTPNPIGSPSTTHPLDSSEVSTNNHGIPGPHAPQSAHDDLDWRSELNCSGGRDPSSELDVSEELGLSDELEASEDTPSAVELTTSQMTDAPAQTDMTSALAIAEEATDFPTANNPALDTPAPDTAANSSTNAVQSDLSIDIPQSLRSGDLVSVVMKSKANPHPACVKLWVINSDNQTVVDGPRWILDFSADGDVRTGITHLTVPSRVQSLQFQACAYPHIPSDMGDCTGINDRSDKVSPVATVTVHRSVSPRSMPYR